MQRRSCVKLEMDNSAEPVMEVEDGGNDTLLFDPPDSPPPQKARKIRQLRKNNRDSLKYYTFCGDIVFGGLRVVLALFPLTMSIAQTVTSFRSGEHLSMYLSSAEAWNMLMILFCTAIFFCILFSSLCSLLNSYQPTQLRTLVRRLQND